MKSCAAAALAAAMTSARRASGRPKAMLSRMVPVNRVVSCSTMPICARSDSSVTSRRSWPSMVMRPSRRVVEARQQVDDGGLARAGGAQQGDGLARQRLEADLFQDRIAAAEIAEGHIARIARGPAPPGALAHRARRRTSLLRVQDLKNTMRPRRPPGPSG